MLAVAELRTLLAGIANGSLDLTAGQLDIPPVTEMFQTYLGRTTLKLANATGDPATLTVTGNLALGTNPGLPAAARFVSDTSGATVTGVVISCELPGWTWTSPGIALAADSVSKFLSAPRLILQAGGNDLVQAAPTALLSGSLDVLSKAGTVSCTLSGTVPIPDADNPQPLLLEGRPDAVLGGLNDLTQFITGADFKIIPEEIPLASDLELAQIGISVGPRIDVVTALNFAIRSRKGLTIVSDTFVIEEFTFYLRVQFPAIATRVYGAIATTMLLDTERVELSVALPELFIEGTLAKDTPIKLKPFLARFAAVDAVPDSFELSDLVFGIGLTSPHNWAFQIGLANLWQFPLGGGKFFTFESLLVNVESAGSSAPDLAISSAYSVAGTQLYLSAQRSGDQWSFAGGTVGYQTINFIPLIEDLAAQFDLDRSTLPAQLTELDLTNIALEYDTGSGGSEFKFSCKGDLKVSDVTATAALDLDVRKSSEPGPAPFTVAFTGTLAIAMPGRTLSFATKVDVAAGATLVIGAFDSTGTLPGLGDLITALGFDAEVPEGLDITLKDLALIYRAQTDPPTQRTASQLAVTVGTQQGDAVLAALRQPVAGSTSVSTTYLFGLTPQVSGSLTDLPLIGARLPASLDLSLKSLSIVLASTPLTTERAAAVNALFAELASEVAGLTFRLPDGPLASAAEFALGLDVGGTATTFDLDLATRGARSPATRLVAPSPAPNDASSSAKWLSIQKSFGPLAVNRIGFDYGQGEVEFLLDASLSLSALSVDLMGLAIKSPPTRFTPSFALHGMGLNLNAGALRIAGALLSTTPGGLNDPVWEYAGEVVVTAEVFSIAGIGAYGEFDHNPSFFLFAMINAPLGGPASFFVTGLAAGFGYNRALLIPTVDKLTSFPLVAAATASQTGVNPFSGTANDPAAALAVLDQYLPMSVGSYWAAVGLQFTSFEIIQSFALVTIAFGTRFEVALLGVSTVTEPPLSPDPIGFAELLIEVTFVPEDGLLAATAQLSPASYILARACHLTGGFAFYLWFRDDPVSGAKAGDFVVTLGGYYPGYEVPKFYPTVPALGVNWQVSDNLAVKGGLYFALIPSAVMAGGYLDATWQSGDIKAWFTANVNFLLSWKPFHYQANLSLSIGASFRLDLGFCSVTVTVHVGVALAFWGPSFAGRAHVDLDVISFTIGFGPDWPAITPIPWSEFKSSFLAGSAKSQPIAAGTAATGAPSPTDTFCSIAVAAGMLVDLTASGSPDGIDWVVSPETMRIVTGCVVPTTAAQLVTGSGDAQHNQQIPLEGPFPADFGVGPVGIADGNLSSEHVITINKLGPSGPDYSYVVSSRNCAIDRNTANLPRALWSKALSLDLVENPNISAVNAAPSTIPDMVTGFTIAPRLAPADETAHARVAVLAAKPAAVEPQFSWSATPFPITDRFDQAGAMDAFSHSLVDPATARVRLGILAALTAQGLPVRQDITVGALAREAPDVLLAPPVLSLLGEERVSTLAGGRP